MFCTIYFLLYIIYLTEIIEKSSILTIQKQQTTTKNLTMFEYEEVKAVKVFRIVQRVRNLLNI